LTVIRQELIASLPKLFALIGDAITSKTGWVLEIRAAGIGENEKTNFFMYV
jgi:hypothetical protein